MRGYKIAAAVVGAIIAFLLVSWVIGAIVHIAIDVAIAALVVGGIVVAIKVARSNKQVSSKPKEREVRDAYSGSTALPQADLEQYSAPRPAPTRPAPARPAAQDVDDELARLKREMGRG